MFSGRRADDETALYYYRARYYAFDIGRFLQPDPICYEDGLNLYIYVGNNPVIFVDPLGLIRWSPMPGTGVYLDTQTPPSPPRQYPDHMDEAVPYQTLIEYSMGKTLRELQTERGYDIRSVKSTARGPIETRYVVDPANPDQAIDIRHFLVVGPKGERFGRTIEMIQDIIAPHSAWDPMDLRSNKLGADLYKNYYKKYKDLMPFWEILEKYFEDRSKEKHLKGRIKKGE